MSNYRSRADANQKPIVDALRAVGWKVRSLTKVGDDFPDIIAAGFAPGRGVRNVLLEVKAPGEPLSKGQQEFADSWPGERHTVHNAAEALEACLGKDVMA